jgi:hypothetical protein
VEASEIEGEDHKHAINSAVLTMRTMAILCPQDLMAVAKKSLQRAGKTN